MLALLPLLNPVAYTGGELHDDVLQVTPSGRVGRRRLGHPVRARPDLAPLQAAVRAVDPHLDVEVSGTDEALVADRRTT